MEGMSETARMTMWRNAIGKEQNAARTHHDKWGFLSDGTQQTTQNTSRPFAIRPTKYYAGTATVIMKRLPMLPQDKVEADSSHAPDVEQLISTRNFTGTRPLTAMDSTLHSHAKSLHDIRVDDPFFKCTSQVYGSRLPIEQFGVAHYGHQESAITRWERREYLL